MDAMTTLRTLRRRGYSAAVEGGKLKLRGPAKPPEELEASILEYRGKLVRLVEEEIIVDEREAFDVARAFFGKSREGGMSEKDWLFDRGESVPLQRVIDKGEGGWADYPAFKRLLCPVCGDYNQHTGSPQMVSEDDYQSGWGGRGDVIIVPMQAECDHKWEICFGFHKGETFAFARVPNPPGDAA